MHIQLQQNTSTSKTKLTVATAVMLMIGTSSVMLSVFDWLFMFECGGFFQIKLEPENRARKGYFHRLLIHYYQFAVTVLTNMTKFFVFFLIYIQYIANSTVKEYAICY